MRYIRMVLLWFLIPIFALSCGMYGSSKARFKDFEMNETIRYGSMFTLEEAFHTQGLLCQQNGGHVYPHLVLYNLRGEEAVVRLLSRPDQNSEWTTLFETELLGTVNKEVFQLDKEYITCISSDEDALETDLSSEACNTFLNHNENFCGSDSGFADCFGSYEIAIQLISGEKILAQTTEECSTFIEVAEDLEP
jgi:hypothetical protein